MDDYPCENFLKILTLNCQGLGDMNKRRDVFKILKEKKLNVYFLQDTHFVTKDESMIKALWGYKAFFSSYKSNSRGVATLINNNCDLTLINEYKDDNGNYLILDVVIDNLPFLLVNIYGPNQDTPVFYTKILNMIQEYYSSQYMIIGGDFNLMLDKELDSMNYKNLNNPKSRMEVLKMIEILNLKDIFRENNPNLKRFTWRKKNPIKQARLDYFLISESLLNLAPYVKFENSYRSDHCPVVMGVKTNEFLKGRGFWKLNNSLLADKEYVNLIKEKIKNIKLQYACPIYNFNNIDSIENDKIQFMLSDQLFLDTLLMEIRGKSISYSTFKKKKITEKRIATRKRNLYTGTEFVARTC